MPLGLRPTVLVHLAQVNLKTPTAFKFQSRIQLWNANRNPEVMTMEEPTYDSTYAPLPTRTNLTMNLNMN